MRTSVYVDGFNLYNRAVRGTPYKWLDLGKLCMLLFPKDQIHRIRYFTAQITPRPNDPDQLIRQQIYIRALRTSPNLTVHWGQFRPRRKRRPLVTAAGLGAIVEVQDTEEKGSDVNLATYLLVDGYEQDYEQAIVVSNDSDLALPIEMVRTKLHLKIGVVNPDSKNSSHRDLVAASTFVKRLWPSHLRSSQFPISFGDRVGTITKPPSW